MSIEERAQALQKEIQDEIDRYATTPQPGAEFGRTVMAFALDLVEERRLAEKGWEYSLHEASHRGVIFIVTGYRG
jgi:hypothetical protein